MRRPLSPQQKELVEAVVLEAYNRSGSLPTAAEFNQLSAAGIFNPEMDEMAQQMVLNTVRNAPASYGDGRAEVGGRAESIPADLFLNTWIVRLNRDHANWINAGSPSNDRMPERIQYADELPF